MICNYNDNRINRSNRCI